MRDRRSRESDKSLSEVFLNIVFEKVFLLLREGYQSSVVGRGLTVHYRDFVVPWLMFR